VTSDGVMDWAALRDQLLDGAAALEAKFQKIAAVRF
jgi:hypothetical protein